MAISVFHLNFEIKKKKRSTKVLKDTRNSVQEKSTKQPKESTDYLNFYI